MRILLVVAYFIPEIGSAAHIYFDLAKAFAKQGHDVDVITSYPREFNLNKEDQGLYRRSEALPTSISISPRLLRSRAMTLTS